MVYTKTLCLTHIFNLYFDRKTKQKSLTISSPTTPNYFFPHYIIGSTDSVLLSTKHKKNDNKFCWCEHFSREKKRKQKNLKKIVEKTLKQNTFFPVFYNIFCLFFEHKHLPNKTTTVYMYVNFLSRRELITTNKITPNFFSKMLLRPNVIFLLFQSNSDLETLLEFSFVWGVLEAEHVS